MSDQHFPPPGDQPQYGQTGGQPPQYGQAQYGQPQYGQIQDGQPQYASDQVHSGGQYAPAAVTRPPAIDKAVLFMKIGAGLSILSGLLSLTMKSAYKDVIEKSMRDAGTAVTPDQLDTAVNVSLGMGVVSGLIGAALWWWMAVMNRKGRSWARILSTIFFGISLLSFLYSLRTGSPMLATILSIVEILVGAGAIWFLWQRESSNYFEAASRTR